MWIQPEDYFGPYRLCGCDHCFGVGELRCWELMPAVVVVLDHHVRERDTVLGEVLHHRFHVPLNAMTSSRERTSAEAERVESSRLPHREVVDGLLRPPPPSTSFKGGEEPISALEQILGRKGSYFLMFLRTAAVASSACDI